LLEIKSKCLLATVCFFICTAAPLALAQDHEGSESGALPAKITAVSVAPGGGAVTLEITFSKPVQAQAQAKITTLENPGRLVFDFPGCELALPNQRRAVNRGSVLALRAAAFSVAPPVARVVVDLKSPSDHEETYEGNKLIIKIKARAEGSVSVTEGEVRPLVPEVQPPAAKSARKAQRAAKEESPTRMQPVNAGARSAAPTAYALLAKTQTLTVSDLQPLEAGARAGDPEAETTLGLAYHAGTLLKPNDAEALRLLQLAAKQNFVAAEEALAVFCQSGFGMRPDKAQAISWYTKAAHGGSRDAATNLALMYSTGDGIPKDPAQAATWFRTAADAGDSTAQLNLAALYHRGEGVPQDDAQAVSWLTKAADQGLLPAMIEMAKWNLHAERGNNIDAAIEWCKKAAQGDATAQAVLGDIFSDEKLGRQDYAQAVLWYRKAADQGQREGEFGLGSRYLLGQGVVQDLGEARRWLTPAANQGHPYAQFLLAKMFEEGRGGPADVASARKYYELAAGFGIAEAQYRLARLLALDRDHATSLTSAYKWFVLSQNSIKESAPAAEALRHSLTPAQLAEAEREIDDWRAAHLKPASQQSASKQAGSKQSGSNQ
jgi:TPR repeat protein